MFVLYAYWFPLIDMFYVYRASGPIQLDAVAINTLGQQWGSVPLQTFASMLTRPSNVNAGSLVGNRMFFASDYMVRHTYLLGDLTYHALGPPWCQVCYNSQDVLEQNPKQRMCQQPKRTNAYFCLVVLT